MRIKTIRAYIYQHLIEKQNKIQKSAPNPKCVFLGYSLNHQGYRCLDPSTGRVYLSRHVIFDEQSFPFKEYATNTSLTKVTSDSFVPLVEIVNVSPGHTLPAPNHLSVESGQAHTRPSITTNSSIPQSNSTNPVVVEPSHTMVTRSKLGVHKPNTKYALHVSLDTETEPTCFSQAASKQEWREAMGAEFNALRCNGT